MSYLLKFGNSPMWEGLHFYLLIVFITWAPFWCPTSIIEKWVRSPKFRSPTSYLVPRCSIYITQQGLVRKAHPTCKLLYPHRTAVRGLTTAQLCHPAVQFQRVLLPDRSGPPITGPLSWWVMAYVHWENISFLLQFPVIGSSSRFGGFEEK